MVTQWSSMFKPMTADFDREETFATVMAQISFLPAHQRIDALLAYFVDVIDRMEPNVVRALRDQVMTRFSTCGCSFETSRLMIDFINGHLALREFNRPHASSGS